MRNLPRLLLWTDSPTPYIEAIDRAGLSDRVKIETLSRKDKPTDAQCAETEAVMAMAAPPRNPT